MGTSSPMRSTTYNDTLLIINFDSDDWKDFTQRRGIPICLKMLTGLCHEHEKTQLLFRDHVRQFHLIEQISSEEGIGTHAENVLEKLVENPQVEKLIKKARRE